MASVPGTLFSTYAQSEAIKTQARIQAQQAEVNKAIAEYKATEAIERGKDEEINFRKKIRQVIGSQRANLAASGIEVSSGSALELQQDAASIGEIDALTIRQNARMEAMGYKMSALQIGGQSAIDQASARGARSATLLTGGINTASSVAAFAFSGGIGGNAKSSSPSFSNTNTSSRFSPYQQNQNSRTA